MFWLHSSLPGEKKNCLWCIKASLKFLLLSLPVWAPGCTWASTPCEFPRLVEQEAGRFTPRLLPGAGTGKNPPTWAPTCRLNVPWRGARVSHRPRLNEHPFTWWHVQGGGEGCLQKHGERERQRARGRVWSPPSSVDVGECDAASVVLQSGRQRAGPLPSAAAGHTKQLVTDPSGGMTTLHWAACVWERRADTPSVFLLPRPGIPAVLSSLAQPAWVETNAPTDTKRRAESLEMDFRPRQLALEIKTRKRH